VTGRSIGLVFLLALLWGSSYPQFKIAVETIPPLTLGALRAFFGGLLLLLLLGREIPALWRSDIPLRTYVVQALFNCVIAWVLVAWASQTIDSSLAAVLNSLSPIFTFVITWGITRHEPATARKFVGVLLGLAGVFVIIGIDALRGIGKHTAAEIACVLGSLSYAIAAVTGRRFSRTSPLVPAAGATLVAAAIMIPLALAIDRPWTLAPSMRSLLAMAGLTVFSTVAAFIVYFRLLATVGSIGTTAQAYLRILVGVGFGVLLLGESLPASLIAGVVLVVAGVVAMTLPHRKRSPRVAA
jgi:drug/metabolite transporter (DMT)-like permease